ncbi:hypothetical protein Tco_0498841 [Tanacetum coccineum]
MDDPNITMEEYIRLEKEKARIQGRTFNWQTAIYGKMECFENEDNSFTNLKTEYPAIVFDDTSDATLSCEPTDIADFEERLERIHDRGTHRVQVLDFKGMPELMRDVMYARMRMEHRDSDGVVVFTSKAWGRVFDTRGPLVREFILECLSMLRFGEVLLNLDAPGTIHESERIIPRKGDQHDYWRDISTDGDFFIPPSSYTLIGDPVLRIFHRMMEHNIAVTPGGGDEDEEMPQAVPPPPRTQGPVCLTRDIQSHRLSTKDAPNRGPETPALPQPRSIQTLDFSIPYLFTGSKFSAIVREYVTEPSTLPKSRAELRRESVYKSVEAEEKVELNDWLKQKCFPGDNPVVFNCLSHF